MSKYRILALDGGGIGGLVTAKLLYNLCRKPGLETAFESADLIAGNSSGGLIALAMAHGLGETKMVNTLAKIVAVFEGGEKVFGPGLPWWLGGFWLVSKHRTRERERAFRGALGEIRLGDFNRKVLISTFDLDDEARNESQNLDAPAQPPTRRWKPKLFHNFVRRDDPHADRERAIRRPDREHFAWEVALYTTAAPSYFPSVDGYIDGGVYANNPSMCALAQAFDERYEGGTTRQLRDIALFSVSAGRNPTFIEKKTLRGGALWWGTRYVGITMDGTVGVADYECEQMLGSSRYRRVDADFPAGMKVKLDDVKKIGELKTFADAIPLEEDAQWLRQNWMAGDQPGGGIPKQQGAIPMIDTTSKHLLGSTELTCLMPIRSGFVGEFETRTYATRLRIAMKVLSSLRAASREFAPARVFPDIVDVIRSIHSFQLSIIDNRRLLLAVTFDGPWENYMRFVWKGLGPLLDLLLINCVDYEASASDRGFDRFSDWVRRHQIDTGLFYTVSGCSVDDIRYLTQLERAQRNEACPEKFDKAAALLVARDAVTEAKEAAHQNPQQVRESGLRAIAAFYGLRESYPSQTPGGVPLPDARYLLRAARETLKAFDTQKLPEPLRQQYGPALKWFENPVAKTPVPANRQPAFEEMQGGILPGKRRQANVGKSSAAHGCLLLARVVNPVLARTFLSKELVNYVSRQQGERPHDVDTNIAFTFSGLKRMGVTAADLAPFPKEFREGMEARAGMLGDVRSNHPTNWSLPEWNWPPRKNEAGAPVRLSTIDVVIKMRIAGPEGKSEHSWSANHPLYHPATKLFADPNKTGIQVMSVQPMLHHVDAAGANVIDHFGFVDGISQPKLEPDGDPTKGEWNNQVSVGELFLGYQNDRTDPPFLKHDDPDALHGRHVGSLLDNGTFLVVRKLEQHVGTLYEVLDEFLEQNKDLGWTRRDVLARMAGRELNGDPVTIENGQPMPPDKNTFTYAGDDGSRCPLHAHIRRANPRDGRVPRIMRRGMSYGPRFDDPSGGERGLMFLAYNASIAEQFEVVQRWLAGGNSTGGFSGHADPILGIPQKGEQGVFRFVHDGKVRRLDLGDDPFVELKWGMYLFVPSVSAIKAIAAEPKPDTGAAKAQIAQGERIMASLQTDDDWSAILEDVTASSSGQNAAVYAAVRARGGVLRTPGRSMVLVASEPLVREVLGNDRVFSVREYKARMAQSTGEVYLGLDFGDEYKSRSRVNALVTMIGEEEAFRVADEVTGTMIETLLAKGEGRPVTIALEAFADQVLAKLSTYWFGVPNGVEIFSGGRPVEAEHVHLPYHSLAPSRYIFSSPFPREFVTAAGQRQGKQLLNAVANLAKAKGIAGFPSALARQLWEMTPDEGGAPKYDVFARMLVGFIEGFLPTVYGNFLKTMHVWVSEETLWRVQQDLRSDGMPQEPYDRAREIVKPALQRTMQRRPVPDIVYRTATQRHTLNGETIEAGERIVVLIASATQEMAARPFAGPDVTLVFGGNRKEQSHPTHACPAYDMGIGVLLGMLSAMLEATTLSPTESPLAVEALPFAQRQGNVGARKGVIAG